MRASDLETLINRGRKAGLATSEIYSALSARRPGMGDQGGGNADTNGFVSLVDREGHFVYRPAASHRRP